MTETTPNSEKEIWKGRPWILPYATTRTIIVAIILGGVLFVENSMNSLYTTYYGLRVLDWTLIAFFIVWILAVFKLLVLRTTNFYILRVDSLEIKTGFLTTKNSLIIPTGFSDLEVIRSIISRIYNTGDIMIKTQSERDFTKKMVKVKDPMRVANLIRDVMARQIFKLDEKAK